MCIQNSNSLENEFTEGLAKKNAEHKSENARDDILHFYHSNEIICKKAYQYYKEYERNKPKYVNEPIKLEKSKFLDLLNPQKILILTATSIERGVLIHWLSEKQGSPLAAYRVGSYSYNVYNVTNKGGTNGRDISIIHVDPGRTGDEFTRKAIDGTCKIFQPDYIIALGICYGFDRDRYSIGHVFLSESVTVFRINFRDGDNGTIKLEMETEFEEHPAHHFVQSIREYIMYIMAQNFLSQENEPIYARVECGKFLSINSLVSNEAAKQALLGQYSKTRPKHLGGEMECAGILKSDIVQDKGFSNWLVIKSVCDWGEMKNNLDPDERTSERIKDSIQAFAMTNTCSVFGKIIPVFM